MARSIRDGLRRALDGGIGHVARPKKARLQRARAVFDDVGQAENLGHSAIPSRPPRNRARAARSRARSSVFRAGRARRCRCRKLLARCQTLQPLKEESGFRDVQKPFRAMEWQQGMSGVVMGLHEGAIGDDGRSPPFTSHVYGDLRSHAPTADKRPASNRNVAKSRGAPKEIGRDLVAVHEQPHRSLAVIN